MKLKEWLDEKITDPAEGIVFVYLTGFFMVVIIAVVLILWKLLH